MIKKRKAAIELSLGTIIIIVLGVTMLILGMVLVRAVMCSAISLTEETGKKASSELEKYFEEKGDEVVCIGESGEASIVPGARNYIWCSFDAPEGAEYTIKLDNYFPTTSTLSQNTIKSWIVLSEGKWAVSPGDKKAKAPIILNVPKNAPEGGLKLTLQVKKKISGGTAEVILSPEVYLKVTRVGFVRSAIC
jgi:hypothetical protein